MLLLIHYSLNQKTIIKTKWWKQKNNNKQQVHNRHYIITEKVKKQTAVKIIK